MTRWMWLRLVLHGGTFGVVAGLLLLELFGDGGLANLLWTALAAGVLAGALAGAVLYRFRHAAALWRRWLAWPIAATAGGLLFFASILLVLKDWRLDFFLASVWALGWLCFLWRPDMLTADAEG